jgi:hypothetical protein
VFHDTVHGPPDAGWISSNVTVWPSAGLDGAATAREAPTAVVNVSRNEFPAAAFTLIVEASVMLTTAGATHSVAVPPGHAPPPTQ